MQLYLQYVFHCAGLPVHYIYRNVLHKGYKCIQLIYLLKHNNKRLICNSNKCIYLQVTIQSKRRRKDINFWWLFLVFLGFRAPKSKDTRKTEKSSKIDVFSASFGLNFEDEGAIKVMFHAGEYSIQFGPRNMFL